MILKERDGKPRPTWYGRISVRGKRRETNLNVPIEGSVPLNGQGVPILSIKGDSAFERSRRAALKALDKWRKEAQKDPAELAAKAYKARTGVSIEGAPLAKLADLWESQNRTYTPTADWCAAVRRWFESFSTFARKHASEHGARCETINDVTPELVRAWFAHIRGTYSWETVTKQMSLMRNAFKRYATGGRRNPFDDVIMRNRDTASARVSRKPLTATETQRLFDCSRDNETIHQLIVAATCTGMRIGDVCRLKWRDVDLREGLIDVQTAKTGKRVTIPIFERLRKVLDERNAIERDGKEQTEYVFPYAASWYASNPDGLYQAVKPYFGEAVLGDKPQPTDAVLVEDGKAAPKSLGDVIDGANFSATKRGRVLEVYARFKAGARCCEIAASLGVARAIVSMDLRSAERLTGERLRPRSSRPFTKREKLISLTRVPRGGGRRCASIYGWHSLRATFVVLAVEAGVPLPDVQKIVGHGNAEMTMQYFNPEKKHTAERVQMKMRGTVLGVEDASRRKEFTVTAHAATASSIDDLLAALTEGQRKELARKLLAQIM